MHELAILLYDDCQASAISTLIETASLANLQWTRINDEDTPPFTWRTISSDGQPVRAMGGLSLAADGGIDQIGNPDLVFVPAIRSDDIKEMMKLVHGMTEIWGDHLRKCESKGKIVAANCSSVFVLAQAGLLDGRRATTSWWLAGQFRSLYPEVNLTPEKLVTRDARLFCAAAFSACFNLGLDLVSEVLGPRAAVNCARVMLIDANRSTQQPYADIQMLTKHGDDLVLRAQSILLTKLASAPQLEKLSERLRVTSRTLNRRFKAATGETPLEFLQKARIERARQLLEQTKLGLDEVVHRVGYSDTSSFRRLFMREVGVSPFDYRKRFHLQHYNRGTS